MKLKVVLGILVVAGIIVGVSSIANPKKDQKVEVTIVDTTPVSKEDADDSDPGETTQVEDDTKDSSDDKTEPAEDDEESKYEYINNNYKLKEDTDDVLVYGNVRKMSLTERDFCREEAFDEFLSIISFDCGNMVRFKSFGKGVYYADYDKCTVSYNFNTDELTLTKSPIQYS